MIKRWAIRENTITNNSIYVLGIEGSDADAQMIDKELSGFVRLIDATLPPFNHVFELSHITDDDMLEKIRIKIEQCISRSNGQGSDVGVAEEEAKKPINLDGIAPSVENSPAKDHQRTSFVRISRATANPEPVEIPPTEILSLGEEANIEEEEPMSLKLAEEKEPTIHTTDGKVSLATGDMSIVKDMSAESGAGIELDNDLDIGDGTFINLSAAGVKKIHDTTKRIDASSLTGLMGDTNKSKMAEIGSAPAPKASQPQDSSVGNVSIEGPTEKTESKSIFRNIFKKFGGGDKEKTVVNKESVKEAKPVMPKMEQVNMTPPAQEETPAQTQEQEIDVDGPVLRPEPAKNEGPGVNTVGGLIIRDKKTQKKSVIPASPKKEAPVKPAPVVSKPVKPHGAIVGSGAPAHVTEDTKKVTYVHEEVSPSDIFSDTAGDDLMSKMPVDDIFAAETIIDFYANTDSQSYGVDTSPDEIASILVENKAPSSAAPSEEDMIEPPNLLGSAPTEPKQSATAKVTDTKEKVIIEKKPIPEPVIEAAPEPEPEPIIETPVQEEPVAVFSEPEEAAESLYQEESPAEEQPVADTETMKPEPITEEIEEPQPVIPEKPIVPAAPKPVIKPAAPMTPAPAAPIQPKAPPAATAKPAVPPNAPAAKVVPAAPTAPPRQPEVKKETQILKEPPKQEVKEIKKENTKMAPKQKAETKTGDSKMADEKIEILNIAAQKRAPQAPEEQAEAKEATLPPAPPVSRPAPQQPAAPAQRPAAVPPPAFKQNPSAPARPVTPQSPAAPRAVPQAPAVTRAPQAPAGAAPAQRPPVQNPNATAQVAKQQDAYDKTQTIDHTIQIESGKIYKKNNWPIEMPLIPTYTFENMDMSSNRFIHATAMSVIDSLGTLQNPFLLYGESGTGKTHFLNALGYEISKKIGQDKIFYTNGVRLARGIQRYVEENRTAELEEFLNAAEALIIDDIHLTAVNDHNREYISKLLNGFLQDRKQIIISSKYPPESLARFEDLVNFKLDQGWLSEIKAPRPQHFAKIYNKMVEDAELELKEVQAHSFFGTDSANLGTISRNIRRVKVLHRMIIDSGAPARSYEDILTEMMALSGENESSLIIKRTLEEVTTIQRGENKDWGSFGFFFPQESSDKFKWLASSIMQKAKELGIRGGFDFALKSAYSTQNVISSAFKIANICDNKNLKGAIILGPSLTVCPPAIRENFYDILTHMLEVMNMRCGIVDPEFIKHPSAYMKVLGDVLK